jgi:hypothetical protein
MIGSNGTRWTSYVMGGDAIAEERVTTRTERGSRLAVLFL